MKKIIAILLILAALGAVMLGIRFLFGGSEDTWICDDGVWVKHGNPSIPKPLSGCGEEITTEEKQLIISNKFA